MTRYSCYRPAVEEVTTEKMVTSPKKRVDPFVPIMVVGAAAAAAMMVLLLLTQSQLSQMSFKISALEQELIQLETQYEKLRISHAKAYSPDRIEEYAVNQLGMIHPNPDQIHYIEIHTADSSRKEPEG